MHRRKPTRLRHALLLQSGKDRHGCHEYHRGDGAMAQAHVAPRFRALGLAAGGRRGAVWGAVDRREQVVDRVEKPLDQSLVAQAAGYFLDIQTAVAAAQMPITATSRLRPAWVGSTACMSARRRPTVAREPA